MSKQNSVFLIFPNQLFENIEALLHKEVYLIEEYLFFKQYNFHQQKILLHRASMQYYLQYLLSKNIKTHYIDNNNESSDVSVLLQQLAIANKKNIYYYDVVDNWLERKINKAAITHSFNLQKLASPMFINNQTSLQDYFGAKQKNFQTDFYILQRKQLQILIDAAGKPDGGKWTYDAENRVKYPKTKKPPLIVQLAENNYVKEAKEYTALHFGSNVGSVSNAIIYPTTHLEAKEWFLDFLQHRFNEFGTYEDAIVSNETILHHSVLTPLLNIGLLTPSYIVNEIIEYALHNQIPLNSTEGFIRQIIGWREFIRGVYQFQGSKQRTTNYWNFSKKIPASFYNGTTGIVPIDDTIKKVLNTGYCHHIERLMILGNFMLLCEFDPNEVYRWFMELFIDAYDWVMVPNVYGMSQFADGGLMATKPYISGSNYLIKMSDYKKTNLLNGWDVIWDGLFWRFMHKQRSFFLQNPRLSMLVHTFDKMPLHKKEIHLQNAENFLNTLM